MTDALCRNYTTHFNKPGDDKLKKFICESDSVYRELLRILSTDGNVNDNNSEITQLKRAINELNDRVVAKQQAIHQLTQNLNTLEAQSKSDKKAHVKQLAQLNNQIQFLQQNMDSLQAVHDQLATEKNTLIAHIDELTSQLNAAQSTNNSHLAREQEATQIASQNIAQCKEQIATLKREIKNIRADRTSPADVLEQRIAKLSQELDQAKVVAQRSDKEHAQFMDTMRQQIQQLKTEIKTREQDDEAKSNQLHAKMVGMDTEHKQHQQAGLEHINNLQYDITRLKAQVESMTAAAAEQNQVIEKLRQELQTSVGNLEAMTQTNSVNSQKLAVVEARVKDLVNELNTAVQDKIDLDARIKSHGTMVAESELRNMEATLSEMQAQLNKATAALSQSENENASLKTLQINTIAEINRLTEKLQTLNEKYQIIQTLFEEMKPKEEELKAALTHIDSLKKEIKTATKDMQTLRDEKQVLTKRLEAVEQINQILTDENKELHGFIKLLKKSLPSDNDKRGDDESTSPNNTAQSESGGGGSSMASTVKSAMAFGFGALATGAGALATGAVAAGRLLISQEKEADVPMSNSSRDDVPLSNSPKIDTPPIAAVTTAKGSQYTVGEPDVEAIVVLGNDLSAKADDSVEKGNLTVGWANIPEESVVEASSLRTNRSNIRQKYCARFRYATADNDKTPCPPGCAINNVPASYSGCKFSDSTFTKGVLIKTHFKPRYGTRFSDGEFHQMLPGNDGTKITTNRSRFYLLVRVLDEMLANQNSHTINPIDVYKMHLDDVYQFIDAYHYGDMFGNNGWIRKSIRLLKSITKTNAAEVGLTEAIAKAIQEDIKRHN